MLELEKQKIERTKRCAVMIRNKLDFPKARGFKRSNSFTPDLDNFEDMDDQDALDKQKDKRRRSINFKRGKFNRKLDDVVEKRLIKDILDLDVESSSEEEGEGEDEVSVESAGRAKRKEKEEEQVKEKERGIVFQAVNISADGTVRTIK